MEIPLAKRYRSINSKDVSVLKIVSISSVLFVRFMVSRSTCDGHDIPVEQSRGPETIYAYECRTFKHGSFFSCFELDVSFPTVPAVLFVWRLFSIPFPKENVSPC